MAQGLAEPRDQAVEAAVGHDQDGVPGLHLGQQFGQEGIGVGEIPGLAAGLDEVGYELRRGEPVVFRGFPEIRGLAHQDEVGGGQGLDVIV